MKRKEKSTESIPGKIEKLYRLSEACKILNVHRNTLYQYIYSGRIKAQRVVRNWQIPESELLKFAK